MAGALEGICVVDVAGTVATAYCGKLFADHGARVIDVEPAAGFQTRRLGPFISGEDAPNDSALHTWLSTNKSSVVHQQDADWFERLLTRADVVLATRLPAAIETLVDGNAKVVVNEITWFGKSGPYAEFRGSDAAIQSLAGLVKGIGKPESAPLLPTGYQAQIVGGITAFVATMTQVLARELGNRDGGARLDTSILDANLCFTEVGAVGASQTGYRGGRWGINRFPPTYPLGIYPCRDGWLGVTALTPAQWLSLCELLDLKDEAAEARYQAVGERLADAERLDVIIKEKLATLNAVDLFERGQAMRIPLAPVPTMAELLTTDQYVERGAFADIQLPGGSHIDVPVTPFRLFATPAMSGGQVTALGADTEAIHREFAA